MLGSLTCCRYSCLKDSRRVAGAVWCDSWPLSASAFGLMSTRLGNMLRDNRESKCRPDQLSTIGHRHAQARPDLCKSFRIRDVPFGKPDAFLRKHREAM